jgi:hypothetical protein
VALVTIIEPQSEPVLLSEAKLFLRVDADNDQDDELITSLIAAARRWCEVYTRRRFLYQTVRLEMDFFPGYIIDGVGGGASHFATTFLSGANAVLAGIRYAIQLPFPPVRGIAAFTYTDQNGTVTPVLSGTQYVADFDSQPARLMPPFGQFWPVAQVIGNAVRVDFITGYGGNITVSMTQGSAVLTANAAFLATDVGLAIKVPGAGANNAALVTTIASVDGSGVATLAASATTAVSDVPAYAGKPVPDGIKTAIKLLVDHWYEGRTPADADIPRAVKAVLGPYRDLRV